MSEESSETAGEPESYQSSMDIELATLSSVALARLVDEVRNEEPATAGAYDRVHNRHNR